jgi:hypothetical protein
MTLYEIRNMESEELAKFLEAGKNVQADDKRTALANAFRRIADLDRRVKKLEGEGHNH